MPSARTQARSTQHPKHQQPDPAAGPGSRGDLLPAAPRRVTGALRSHMRSARRHGTAGPGRRVGEEDRPRGPGMRARHTRGPLRSWLPGSLPAVPWVGPRGHLDFGTTCRAARRPARPHRRGPQTKSTGGGGASGSGFHRLLVADNPCIVLTGSRSGPLDLPVQRGGVALASTSMRKSRSVCSHMTFKSECSMKIRWTSSPSSSQPDIG